MKKQLITLLTFLHVMLFLAHTETCLGQGNLPQERVVLHTDKPFYVTGETIWFKADCLDPTQVGLRSLSKVLYVDIINKEGSSVKQVKLELKNGATNGQILITPDLISDKYQLRAYTSWMKNFGEENFSAQELSIINPSAPPIYELSEMASTTNNKSHSPASNSSNTKVLSLTTKVFGEKEKVTVSLNPSISADLSLSVYKYHEFLEEDSRSPKQQMSVANTTNPTIIYAPEIRAPLVSGKVSFPDSLPKNLYAVFTGSESDISFVSINDSGEFMFEVAPNLVNKQLLFWSNGRPIDPDGISIETPFMTAGEKDLELKLDTTIQSFLEASIFNIQASHAYDSISNIKGKVGSVKTKQFFYGAPDARYLLDDFTRFETIRETIVEYVREAFLKKNKLTMLYERANGAFDGPALVLLDGVPVKEDSLIMNFNPKRVESIEIVTDYYVIGTEIFKGIINFITFERDYGNIPSGYLVEKPYQELLQTRTFFSPSYESEEPNRIPDFRNTLHWEPNIKLNQEKKEVSFYTSMSTGTYKIELAGITKEGIPFLEEMFFEVLKRSD